MEPREELPEREGVELRSVVGDICGQQYVGGRRLVRQDEFLRLGDGQAMGGQVPRDLVLLQEQGRVSTWGSLAFESNRRWASRTATGCPSRPCAL